MKKRTVITIYVVVGALLIGFAIWYFAIPSPTPKREVPKVTTTTMTVEQKLNVRVDGLESRMKNLEAKLDQLTSSQPTHVDTPTQTTPTEVVTVQPPTITPKVVKESKINSIFK